MSDCRECARKALALDRLQGHMDRLIQVARQETHRLKAQLARVVIQIAEPRRQTT